MNQMMNYFYKDYDALFERFSIMTIDGKLDDRDAVKILKEHTTPELYVQLLKEIMRLSKK